MIIETEGIVHEKVTLYYKFSCFKFLMVNFLKNWVNSYCIAEDNRTKFEKIIITSKWVSN